MSARHKPISDQVIVITGATSGIGLATAREAAARGAAVVLAARNGDALERVAADIRDRGGAALAVAADVSRREDHERLAETAVAAFGRIDSWVNNAGQTIFGRIEEISDADHRRLFEVNFWGCVYGSTVAVRHLRRSGGALVNLGSVASDTAFPIQGMYCATKHAIKGFTDALRMELQSEDAPVTLTLIKPAAINTPLPENATNYMDRRPSLPPPVYAPEDVAAAILHAAEHGGRDIYVGGGARLLSSAGWHVPRATDWMGARFGGALQSRDGDDPDRAGTLYEPGQGGEVHGTSPHPVMRSAYTQAVMHPLLAAPPVAGAGLTAALLLRLASGGTAGRATVRLGRRSPAR